MVPKLIIIIKVITRSNCESGVYFHFQYIILVCLPIACSCKDLPKSKFATFLSIKYSEYFATILICLYMISFKALVIQISFAF